MTERGKNCIYYWMHCCISCFL